jgi:ribonuclease HII
LANRLVSRRSEPPSKGAASAKGAARAAAALVDREQTFGRLEAFDIDVARRDRPLGGEPLRLIAGVDEAGRGALAGPVACAAVILPSDSGLIGVDDSKKLSEKTREELFDPIVSTALAVTVAFGHPPLIDAYNILQATLMTMHRAVSRLRRRPDLVLVDGRDTFQWEGPVVAITKGDSKSLAIAAASIVAKVARDRLMRKLHGRFPHYNFASNKGYGSREHLEAILSHGPGPVHRQTFHPKIVEKVRGLL